MLPMSPRLCLLLLLLLCSASPLSSFSFSSSLFFFCFLTLEALCLFLSLLVLVFRATFVPCAGVRAEAEADFRRFLDEVDGTKSSSSSSSLALLLLLSLSLPLYSITLSFFVSSSPFLSSSGCCAGFPGLPLVLLSPAPPPLPLRFPPLF